MSNGSCSRPDKKGNSLSAYFPEARQFRYPHFTKACGLGFKARLVWSALLAASRFHKGYSGRRLSLLTGVHKNTVAKLLRGELAGWVEYKTNRAYAVAPPESAVRRMTGATGKWQSRLASIPLLMPAKEVKPLEAVILSFLVHHGNKYHRSGIANILSVHRETVYVAMKRLRTLGLISDDLLPVLPTPEQRGWFLCVENPKTAAPPSYSSADYRIGLLIKAGYPDRIIEQAVSLGWLEWSMAAALREVSYCEQTHGKNRERYPNVPNGCNLFLQRMSKRKTKKMKFTPPPAPTPTAPSATDWSEYEEQHRERRRQLQEEAKAKQKKRTPPPKPTPEDEWDAVIDEMNGRLG